MEWLGCATFRFDPAQKIHAKVLCNGGLIDFRHDVPSSHLTPRRLYFDFLLPSHLLREQCGIDLELAESIPSLAESSRTPASVGWGARKTHRWDSTRPAKQCGASDGHSSLSTIVTDMMVGNRRAPGATILGGVLKYLTCQPSLLCPTDGVSYFVMGGSSGQCTRWRASRRSELLRQPLPFFHVVAATFSFSRFVTPLCVRDSYVWFEGALPLTDASESSSQHPGKCPERCLKQGQKLGGNRFFVLLCGL